MSRSKHQAQAAQRNLDATEELPAAPASLSSAAARYWHEAVSSVPAGHFSRCDHVLLSQWSTACVHLARASERLEADPESAPALAGYSKLLTAVSGLAVRLRLCPSSRNRRKDVAAGDAYERDSVESMEELQKLGYFGGG